MQPLAVNQKQAAALLGISVNTFKAHVRPGLKFVIVAGLTRWPVEELEQWVRDNTYGG